ncbi:hypothetical protein C8R44DRAFT_873515 [Mycena epipterygia]|nr:hypothetical protein C8R44DRAFT_873515 [Mycena epipterygia]
MVWKRRRPDSDYDPTFQSPPKRRKPPIRTASSLPPSSPPPPATPDDDYEPGPLTPNSEGPMDAMEPLGPLPALFPSSSSNAVASGSGQTLHTPQRAESLPPRASSPMSIVDVTPLKPNKTRGRPTLTPHTRSLKQAVRTLSSSQRSPDQRRYNEAVEELQNKAIHAAAEKERVAREHSEAKARDKKLAEELKAKEDDERQAIIDAEDTR